MKRIKTVTGPFVIVDDQDFERLNRYRWSVVRDRNTQYASAWINGTPIRMHRLILSIPKGHMTDHINGNGLDNRRSNLRIADHSLNGLNARIRAHTSKHKGVTFNATRTSQKKWCGEVSIRGVRARKYFDSEKAAAKFVKETRQNAIREISARLERRDSVQ